MRAPAVFGLVSYEYAVRHHESFSKTPVTRRLSAPPSSLLLMMLRHTS